MKKILLGLLLTISLAGHGQIKNAGCFLRMIEPIESNTLSYTNDSVGISFEFNSMNYFVEVTIENHTNEMIAVDWDKFLIIDGNTSQPIIFDDTVIAFKDVPKGKSQVAPKTKVYRKITARDNIEYPTPFYTKKYIKIRPRQIGFLVPIDYENRSESYKCVIEVYIPQK